MNAPTSKSKYFDVIIIGGGAAGLMCAATAGQRGRSVLVLECTNKLGKKILMSGGGRCNFTNLDIQAENFLSNNPHFFKSALKQYTQWDFIALVAKHGINYREKKHGQLFCENSAKDILQMLEKECVDAGVTLQTKTQVNKIIPPQVKVRKEEGDCAIQNHAAQDYVIQTDKDDFSCQSLVIATGGLSIPTMGGATGFGYQLAEQFNLNVLPKNASLVPMTLSGKWHEFAKQLSGVSVPVSVQASSSQKNNAKNQVNFFEDLLFTHRGISGPAILQLSNYWQLGESITIDLLPGMDLEAELLAAKQGSPKSLLRTQLNRWLPSSLVLALEKEWWKDQQDSPLNAIKNSDLALISKQFHHWLIKPSGTEGYRTAEVTLGGIDTQHLSSKTMEVESQKGLYFIGEVVDVTGHLGGYNFQWAWSSGYVSGIYV